ncbi:MAG: histidine phosphatase family protein [Candidatus Binataceae bacterium]
MALGPFHVADKLKHAVGIKGIALLMRHGETAWNREGRVMGESAVELDEPGRAQVESAVPLARAIKPDLIVTSPLIRARQSAEIIASGIGGVAVIEDAGLAEVRYGHWQGMVYDELIDDQAYIEYQRAPLETRTPGGESIIEVQQRGVEAVSRVMKEHEGGRVLFVSHGDIIRTVLAHYLGMQLSHYRRIRVDNATFSAINIIGDFAEVKFLNLLPDPARAFTPQFIPHKRKPI